MIISEYTWFETNQNVLTNKQSGQPCSQSPTSEQGKKNKKRKEYIIGEFGVMVRPLFLQVTCLGSNPAKDISPLSPLVFGPLWPGLLVGISSDIKKKKLANHVPCLSGK